MTTATTQSNDHFITSAGCRLQKDGSWKCRVTDSRGSKLLVDVSSDQDEAAAASIALRLFYSFQKYGPVDRARYEQEATR